MARSKKPPVGYALAPKFSELTIAAQAGNESLCRHLVLQGADINERDATGKTALMHAIQLQADAEPGVALALIELGADIHVLDNGGYAALHYAALSPSKEICEALIDANGDMHKGCKACGDTPMHLAASKNRGENLKLMIARGGDIHVLSLSGRTPLHRAAGSLGRHALMVLLMAGANPNLFKEGDYSALDIAASNRIDDSCAMLVAYGADPSQAMHHQKKLTMRQAAVTMGLRKRLFELLDQPPQDMRKDNIKVLCKLAIKADFADLAAGMQAKQAMDAINVAMGGGLGALSESAQLKRSARSVARARAA